MIDTREILGDTPEAPCYGLERAKDPFRTAPHSWRSVMKPGARGLRIEVCYSCGGIRRIEGDAEAT